MIPSEGNEIEGAFYSYKDNTVLSDKKYNYKLEAVDYTGISEWYTLDSENMIYIKANNLGGFDIVNINKNNMNHYSSKNYIIKPDNKSDTENKESNTQNNEVKFDNSEELNTTNEQISNTNNSNGCSCSVIN